MMMSKPGLDFHDPESALRALERRRRDQALEAAIREGFARESFGADPRWYVLVVRRRAEERVKEAVEKLGLTAWAPVTKVMAGQRRHGGSRIVERAIFEGFLFVQLTGNNYAWLRLLALDGVSAILGSGNGPLPVSRENMKVLMAMQGAGVFTAVRGARAQARALIAADYPNGARILIKDGPFAYFEAVVEGYVHKRRVRAMTHLFGAEVAVELDVDQIRRLA